MDDKRFEQMIEKLLKQDFSSGTEAFRDALLARCLDELDADIRESDLSDEELEMLAAAGNLSAMQDPLRAGKGY